RKRKPPKAPPPTIQVFRNDAGIIGTLPSAEALLRGIEQLTRLREALRDAPLDEETIQARLSLDQARRRVRSDLQFLLDAAHERERKSRTAAVESAAVRSRA